MVYIPRWTRTKMHNIFTVSLEDKNYYTTAPFLERNSAVANECGRNSSSFKQVIFKRFDQNIAFKFATVLTLSLTAVTAYPTVHIHVLPKKN